MTLTVHVAFAASVPPERAIVVPPAVAAALPAPHVVDAFGVAAIMTPAGNVSVSASALNGTAPTIVLGMVIVKSETAPATIDGGAKASVGARPLFVIVSELEDGAAFETPCVVPRAFAGIVFV